MIVDSSHDQLQKDRGCGRNQDLLSPSDAGLSKTGTPGAAAVVALRHPLLDGHTFVVHESVPEKEWEQSGNA